MAKPKRVYVQDVLVSADALEHRLLVLQAKERDWRPDHQVAADAVLDLLFKARQAARGEDPPYRPLTNWWKGRLLETAYQYLHRAESQMVDLYDDIEVKNAIPIVLVRIQRHLGRDDPRRLRAERILTLQAPEARRAALRDSLESAYSASDTWHRRQRSFRNIIILATAGITVLLALTGWLVFANPTYMPFCFDNVQPVEGQPVVLQPSAPPATAASTTSTGEPVLALKTTSCPTGETTGREPEPADIVIILLMGLLGGSLAAAISIRNVRGSATPYDIPVVLATLKVPSGALTAVVGLVAIRGNFVPGLSALDSQEQILAYALVLGYAQQLATGFLDRKAQSLEKDGAPEPPVKEPTPKEPAPAEATPKEPTPAGPGPEPVEPGREKGASPS